ncbi:Hypothetical protein I595_1434 [Croceitalea dokdonensis DOKDO 023]|uniref:Uncharacterized protein n=1 Tax=Croceitalea dokdonensis DOKDO 023 TaxID=1300341 RepID=A0A0P7AXT6_9FLAO|nr:hypothetical protein [Croceitalea dokdonensis]KPM33007.1 Hypothetical protein I595_1434 [Croceitalea dokdonensis DOKDO 023]
MKRIFGVVVLFLTFSASVNAGTNVNEKEDLPFESCVSIAAKLTKGRPDLFALAYNWCIYERCGCGIK